MSSPLCLPGPEDLKMDLTKKSGLTAGWGATGVTYTETLCGWTRGVTDLDSASDVLKKIEAVRWREGLINQIIQFVSFKLHLTGGLLQHL